MDKRIKFTLIALAVVLSFASYPQALAEPQERRVPAPAPKPKPTGTASIEAIEPDDTVSPGTKMTLMGKNLPIEAVVELFSETGGVTRIEKKDVVTSDDFSQIFFTIPTNIADGTYGVRTTGAEARSATFGGHRLVVQKGGEGFRGRIIPGIPQGYPSAGDLVANIYSWAIKFFGVALFIVVFWAGAQWFITKNRDAAITKLKNALTGGILLLSSYVVLYTINPDLVQNAVSLPGIVSITSTEDYMRRLQNAHKEFSITSATGCSTLSNCVVDIASYTPKHDCASAGGKCLVSSQTAPKVQRLIEKFNGLASAARSDCELKISSAIQLYGGPSASTCHKAGYANSGTCVDFNLLPNHSRCYQFFYDAVDEAGGIKSYLDEYVKKVPTMTGGNIHVVF